MGSVFQKEIASVPISIVMSLDVSVRWCLACHQRELKANSVSSVSMVNCCVPLQCMAATAVQNCGKCIVYIIKVPALDW